MGNDSQYKVATDTINVLSADHSPTRKLKAKEKNPEFVKFGQCIQKHRKAQNSVSTWDGVLIFKVRCIRTSL